MSRNRTTNRHLPPCVYEKHGAYYYVKAGKWLRVAETPEAANDWYAMNVAEKKAGGGTMPELIERVYQHKLPTLARATATAYRSHVKNLVAAFAEFRPEQVTGRHVAQLKVSLSSTPNMANEAVSFLRGVFDYAVEHQLVDSNPCYGIKRYEVTKRRRCPSDEELAAIHGVAGDRLKIIIELLVLTGQRVNDVLKIKRTDATPQGIRFVQQKTGNPLTIAWNPELRATWDRALALHQGNVLAVYLLAGPRGASPHYRTVHTEWHAALRAAGVADLHIHDLRAKSITAAKKQGLDPRAVAGHSSEAMTARYIREHDEPLVAGPSFRFAP